MVNRILFTFLFVALPAFFFVLMTADQVPKEKDIIILNQGKAGSVTFNHSKHLILQDIKCRKCHGPVTEQGTYRRCVECHISKDIKLTLADTYHKFCIECHKDPKYQDKKPPVNCSECHNKAEVK